MLFPPIRYNKTKVAKELNGKTVLITGASFGIGEALAYELADTGATLILVARTVDKLMLVKEKVEQKGGTAILFAADLYKTEEIDKLLLEINKLPHAIDIFVNNAGKSIHRSIFSSMDRNHDFTRTMALNYFAPVQIILALLPILKQNKGHIISVSAVNARLIPAPHWAAYQASKVAFDHWFRAISPEIRAVGMAATTIYLPLVRTRMIQPTAYYDQMPAMEPHQVAKIIAKSIYQRNSTFAPWWLWFGEIGSVLFRRCIEFVFVQIEKKVLNTLQLLLNRM